MKKFKMLKITMLFLFSLCTISLVLVTSKSIYIKQKSEEIKEDIISNIEEIKENKNDIKTEENSKAECKVINTDNDQEEKRYFANRANRHN